MSKRPHIVIFNPDEMRADVMSHLGNQAMTTPNLDKLAAEDGVSFSRAYCQNPVCVPSRCSFFTGLYPHVRGHRTMEYLLRPGEETLFSELRRGGYYVWMNARNDLLAGEIPGWAESHADEIYYGGNAPKAPGTVSGIERGAKGTKYYYSHFKGELALDENGRNYNGDDETVDAAINVIKNPPTDKPMCLFLGLQFPHCPYGVEEPYFSAVNRSKLQPRVKLEDCTGKSRIIERIHEYVGMDEFTEEEWDELRAVYQGMCLKIDDQFGRLVAALKDAGIYDDTAIFVLSDHGDFAGDFGLPEKAQNAFEDCLTRVPLLVKPPKGVDFEPGISDAIAELVDFYATALDFAGVPSSHIHFGRSLRRNLKEHDFVNRKYAACEGGRIPEEVHCDEYHSFPPGVPETMEYYPKMMAQSDPIAHSKGIMFRGERYKYISRVSNQDELYDLQEDPQEMHNLIDDPAYKDIVREMQFDMLKWLEATSDIVPYEYDQRWTPEMLFHRIKRAVPPEKHELVKQWISEGRGFPEIMARLRGSKE